MSDFGGEFVTGIPVLGPFMSDVFMGYGGASLPFISDTVRNIRNVTSTDSSVGKKLDSIIDEMLVAGGALFGLPMSSGRRAINVFYTPEGGFALNPLAFLNADWGDFWASLFD